MCYVCKNHSCDVCNRGKCYMQQIAPKVVEKIVYKEKEHDACSQLEKAIAEQRAVLEYYQAQMIVFGDKIKECAALLEGDVDTSEEQKIDQVIGGYEVHMQNLVVSFNNGMTTLQAMLTQYATCANEPTP